MDHYIINNKKLISKYENIYKEKLDIENLKGKILKGYFDDVNTESFTRFRIFLDICIFLFNNERIHCHNEIINGVQIKKGFKDTVEYYSKEFNKNNEFDNYIYYIKNQFELLSSVDINKPFVAINEDVKKKTLTEQLKIIRKAFAHMQYGNYIISSDGRISIFELYNKSEKNRDFAPQLIILEPIFHDYIKKFYSNNVNAGIIYSDSFFSYYSYKEQIFKKYPIFYKIFLKKDSKISKSKEKMKKIISFGKEVEEFFLFLEKNKDYYIEEQFILKFPEKFFKKNNIENINEKFYNMKFLLDFETQLSNFIFHLIELNDFIIEYKLLNDEKVLIDRLETLKEDEILNVPFKYMFLYLKSINILSRLEDDDLDKIENINVSGFKIKQFKDIIKYIIKSKNSKISYILNRFRNSLAHGNVGVKLNLKGELKFIFKDIFKGREKIIEIKAKDLEVFLSQEKFFENIKLKFKILK